MENARQSAISTNQNKLTPAQLLARQLSGNVVEVTNHKPKIIKKFKLADDSSYSNSVVSTDEPLFDASPPIAQFTDYGPLSTQDKILKLRNKDRYARRVKIVPSSSSLFQVLPNKTGYRNDIKSENDDKFRGSKVAPGMEISFIVRFSPNAKIDYTFDLVVMTEREEFLVPIIAIGKKPIIDFPDTIDFGRCFVKYQSEKPVVIRNVGEKTVRWYLQLPQPFNANKKEGLLAKGCNEQIIVSFFPQERKEYLLEAEFTYDNLKSFVLCKGKAEDGEVSLSKTTIAMDDAYVGLRTHQTLKIINKTNVKVDFEWRTFATEKEEQEKKDKLLSQLKQDEAEENVLLKEIVTCDLSNNDYGMDEDNDSYEQERFEHTATVTKQKRHHLLLARKYNNMRKAIEDDLFLFQDKTFKIEPLSGQVWPNSTLTVTVSFTPLAALKYSCTAFCNVSCKEGRLVFNLTGQGIGPKAVIIPQDDVDPKDVTNTAKKNILSNQAATSEDDINFFQS